MSQCVPSWELDNVPPPAAKLSLRSGSNSTSPDVPMLGYGVAELTWENGQLSMHALGPPRLPVKSVPSSSPSKYTWEKPRAGGTLESIVNQATRLPQQLKTLPGLDNTTVCGSDEAVPWFEHPRGATTPTPSSATMTMDALVPCSNRTDDHHSPQGIDSVAAGNTGVVGSCTRVGSCSVPTVATQDEEALLTAKRARVARVTVGPEWSSRDQSASGSATFGRSHHVSVETCERELGVDFTSTSFESQENTKTATADDSVCHSKPQREAGDEKEKKKVNGKSSVSNKRSRAAAIHNQSERKRRDKINQRMKTLQKLVPNSSKTDKASMLDEVIDYLKQLQAQVHMMSRMNMQPMMMPMTMQQQLQMSMLTPINLGMGLAGMGMSVMDMNSISRPNIAGISPVLHPTAFMPMTSWDGSSGSDRLQTASASVVPDPLAAFLACQSQPMTMDAYSRMAAMYQQLLQQPPAPSSKS